MRKVDLAYMAGIIDGEGSIAIVPIARSTCADALPTYRLQIRLAMCNEWMCRWFQVSFGGGIYKTKPRTCKGRERHVVWTWYIAAQQAAQFLIAIKPYLILKTNQAELALKFQARKHRTGPRTLVEKEAEKTVKEYMMQLHQESYGEKIPEY